MGYNKIALNHKNLLFVDTPVKPKTLDINYKLLVFLIKFFVVQRAGLGNGGICLGMSYLVLNEMKKNEL